MSARQIKEKIHIPDMEELEEEWESRYDDYPMDYWDYKD